MFALTLTALNPIYIFFKVGESLGRVPPGCNTSQRPSGCVDVVEVRGCDDDLVSRHSDEFREGTQRGKVTSSQYAESESIS